MIFLIVLAFWLYFGFSAIWLLVVLIFELVGMAFTFWLGLNSPYTLGLLLVRTLLWPLALFTRLLDGEPLPMD